MLEELGLSPAATPSLAYLLVNLSVGVVLSLVLRWHFTTFASTLSNREEFAQVFPFVLLTTILIITVVKSSLALSLGLVGALSIVRFRTPVKEPEELSYLFVAIAMGLGLGADQTVLTVVAGLAILGVMATLSWLRRDREMRNLYLSIDWSAESPEAAGRLGEVTDLIATHAANTDLRRFDVRGGSIEATYFVDLEEESAIASLVGELQQTFPGIGVTFIDQNRMPSV